MKFTVSDNFSSVLAEARGIANDYANPEIGTEHILYGLIKVKSRTSSLLREYGADLDFAQSVFGGSAHMSVMGDIDFTTRVKNMFSSASRISADTGASGAVGCEHYLYCMLLDQTCLASTILREYYNVNISSLVDDLKMLIEMGAQKEDDESVEDGQSEVRKSENGDLPADLTDMGIDLTKKAREGKIEPVIGRADEIERMIQILCRKTKNNPVLIGEPGVGKSAVVEGLALAITKGDVPSILQNKKVFSLDIASLVAGTKYRGALEEKLKKAIDAIRADGDIILFIDEIHTLAQAGNKEGEVSPADILKPYLARGELQTVGATTNDEYRKYIEKDKALERRFQPVAVNPPSVEDTISILKGLRPNFEKFHKVKLSDEAIEAAVKLSDRYITDRFLPDKAIDLVDEAMSKAKVSGMGNMSPTLREMAFELENLEREKNDAVQKGDYEKADALKQKCNAIHKHLNDNNFNWYRFANESMSEIKAENIAEIVSKWTKIPVTKMTESESERLMHLEEILHKRVIGQDKAIKAVAKAIRRARAGLKDPNRPIGSFLFLGPTGVGKTELTKAISEAVFDNENNVIRIDMSEYMESHSVSKLIGAPPGYSGFDDGGQLTEAVRRRPYSVVLFDEIEKAHADIYNLLLQMLDDGRLTDSQGRTVSFKNTVIIMTSNVGVADLKQTPYSFGFSSVIGNTPDTQRTEEVLTSALKRHFKPEFLNRIDTVCFFHSLSRENIGQIAGIMLDKFAKTLAEKGMELDVTPSALEYIVDKGYDAEYGARPLRRVIEQSIEDNIAESLISGRLAGRKRVVVDLIDGQIKIV